MKHPEIRNLASPKITMFRYTFKMEVRKNLKAIPSRELTYPAFGKGHFILVSRRVFWGEGFALT